MPRAKSDKVKTSVELDAEIEKLKKELEVKRKAKQAADRREKAAADQARAIEEAEFNRDCVENAQTVYLSDYEDEGQTIYELISRLIRPPVSHV